MPALIDWLEQNGPESGRLFIRTAFGNTPIAIAAGLVLTNGNVPTDVNWHADVTLPESSPNLQQAILPMLQSIALRGIDEFFENVAERLESDSK